LIRSRAFAYITGADFIVRSAYQMGKTPLLPLFAASLGAGDAFLGLIVSVSTLTGMVLKPFIGVLSDRWGRRVWLLAGTVFFAAMPFVYRFVHTPEQLFAVRMVHGIATAIYGPVTLAYVAEQSTSNRAERLAWFGSARNAGYVVGPAAAGWMLLTMDPVSVFTVVGILSSLAFLPVVLLPETTPRGRGDRPPLVRHAVRSLVSGGRTPAVWLAGGMEATMYVALYATRTFLPIYALSAGFNVAVVGMFLAVQEGVHLILNPLGGRIGDRAGYLVAVPVGMVVLAAALTLVPVAGHIAFLMGLAVMIGTSQALVFPSTMALVSTRVDENTLATGMGLMGTLRNAGKVAGPALAGLLIIWLDYDLTFRLMGLGLVVASGAIWYRGRLVRRSARQQTAVPA
jgi:MFS family permease